jgi:predicted TPR repeat methyltransferase
MSRFNETMPPDYFEQLYAGDADPWRFASSEYEREKYAETLAALPADHYARGLEIGCSIGVLTQRLASRCTRLVAVDAAAAPLFEARRRCLDYANVAFAQMFVPAQWPAGEFDLILLSEVVYYLDAGDVAALAARVASALAPRGDVVLVHWTGETDYPLTADEAVELFIARLDGAAEVSHQVRRPEYRLDVLAWRRP